MFRAIATVVIALTATSAMAANARQENFTRQYKCALEQMATMTAVPGPAVDTLAHTAAEVCVTPASMASEYRGHIKYEARNPETVAKELAERRSHIVSALCRKTAAADPASQRACAGVPQP